LEEFTDHTIENRRSEADQSFELIERIDNYPLDSETTASRIEYLGQRTDFCRSRALDVLLVIKDIAFELIGLSCDQFSAIFTQDIVAMQNSFEIISAP
jgi:hypothetical protein